MNMWEYIVIGVMVLANLAFFLYYKRKVSKMHEDVVEMMPEKIISSVPDMIFMVDGQLDIQKIYNADSSKLSLSAEALIGRNLKDCVIRNVWRTCRRTYGKLWRPGKYESRSTR